MWQDRIIREEEINLGWGLYEQRNSRVQKTGTINRLLQEPKQCEMWIYTSVLRYIHTYTQSLSSTYSIPCKTPIWSTPFLPSHLSISLVIIPSHWWWGHHIWLQQWCQPTIIHGVKTLRSLIWKSCWLSQNQPKVWDTRKLQTWIQFSHTLNSSVPKLIYIITKTLTYPSCYSDTKVEV